MKNKSKLFTCASLALAVAIAVPYVADALPVRQADAATTEYGDELVQNGTLDSYENSFVEIEELPAATSPSYTAHGGYDLRENDIYSMGGGGRAQYVLTEDRKASYVRLAYSEGATEDVSQLWIQPGYLNVDSYTVTLNIEAIGLSADNLVELRYNGSSEIGAKITGQEGYSTLADSTAYAGAKVVSYDFTLDAGTEFPATLVWFQHNRSADIELRIYDVTYTDDEGTVVYYNDFEQPFETKRTIEMPHYGYNTQEFGGIYTDNGDIYGGWGQVVENVKLDGSREHYMRLYDNDAEDTRDTMNMWLQPGWMEAGNYKYEVDFVILGTRWAQYCEFNVYNGGDNLKKVTIGNGSVLQSYPLVNGVRHVELEYTLEEGAQYNAFNIWFYHQNNAVQQLLVYKIKLINTDTNDVLYENDFSEPFTRTATQAPVNEFKGHKNATGTVIVRENENIALKMQNVASFETPVAKDGVGMYRVEFDVKVSDDYTGKLAFHFNGNKPVRNSSELTVASKKADFDFLDESESNEGWLHFVGSVMINNFMAPYLESLCVSLNGWGTVYLDNLSVTKRIDSVTLHETPSTEGLEFRNLVFGGDFEYLEAGTKFVALPQNDTYFWGSPEAAAAAEVVDNDGNKVLKLDYSREDGAKTSTNAFVFLDQSQFSADKVYTFSYKFKYEGNGDFEPEKGLRAMFASPIGVDHYIMYLNYLDELQETSGVNPNEWPFVVTELEDGWKQIDLVFKMDSTFISQVDSIYFLNYHNMQEDVTLYLDDVVFGVWETPQTDEPGDDKPGTTTDPEKPDGGRKGCKGCGSVAMQSGAATTVIVLTAVFVALMFNRKRKNGDKGERE